MRKKRKTTCLLQSSKYKFYLLTPSLHQIPYRMLVLCFFRFIATWLVHISYYIEKSSDYLVINICDYMQFNFLHSISTFCTVRDGDGQNTDPQSMDYPNGLPKCTTLKWTTLKNTISDVYYMYIKKLQFYTYIAWTCIFLFCMAFSHHFEWLYWNNNRWTQKS